MAAHHLLIMAALQMVEEKRIDFLAISMPPRHGKSELVSVRFPGWYLGRHPDRDVIHVSYGADLSNDFSRRVRMLVRDDAVFRGLFSGVALDPERQRVNDWRLVNGGGFRSVGAKGGVTGHGADLLVIDDPHKEGEAESVTALQEVIDWYASAARTRLMPGGQVVIAGTRWHPMDLIGSVLRAAKESGDADQWAVLTLPGLAEGDDPLGREPGAALWPEWFSREALLAVRALSERHFEALYQQNPRASAVQMFLADDFRVAGVGEVEVLPGAWCFDLALGEADGGDYCAWARVHYDRKSREMVFSHLHRERLTWPEAKVRIVELMDVYRGDVFVFPKQTFELMAVQALRYERPNARVVSVSFPAGSDKVGRAQALADLVRAGRVSVEPGVLNGGLTERWIREYVEFPAGRHDDMVDVGSVAVHHFGVHREFAAAVVDLDREVRRRAGARAVVGETVGRLGHVWVG